MIFNYDVGRMIKQLLMSSTDDDFYHFFIGI